MSRSTEPADQPRHGFPRVSGDEPLIAEGGNEDVQFSPRERG